MWDAMEFEDEYNESTIMALEGRGDIDAEQTKEILWLR